MTNSLFFFNRCFDKKRLKNFILWFFNKYGTYETIQLIENLKKIGFQYATEAGISIGIDDLKIPRIKSKAVHISEKKVQAVEISYLKGNVSEIEKKQQFIEEWNFVSETLKNNVIQFFKTTDIFNPIYMIAFSGARGNISQVRQLIAMRGLMVDPQGKLLDFPIRSNFREGLNLTEYIISCYGARKGVVDTALRTATSGYLTRRLVDVAQQIIIGQRDCGTNRGVQFKNLVDGPKTLLSIKDRLIGRILLKDVLVVNPVTNNKCKIGVKNQEISSQLAFKLSQLPNPVFLRSPLTCHSRNTVCQMCYGWSLAHSTIVSIGEAVGVLAAQSIGEPGTQLTMRTFHTGGIFTGNFIDRIFAPFDGFVEYLDSFQGLLVRTLNGQVGFLTKTEGRLHVKRKKLTPIDLDSTKKEVHDLALSAQYKSIIVNKKVENFLSKIQQLELMMKTNKKFLISCLIFHIPLFTTLLIRNGNLVFKKSLIAELSANSFLTNQRQETEQDIFSPVSGQIFFDDLVLVEKITRDGNLQRISYGVGSIWVISGSIWENVYAQNSIPLHGDIIEHSSTIQRFRILIEHPYYLDLKLSSLINQLKLFKFNPFYESGNDISLEPKFKSFNTFLFRKDFLSLEFQKMYYRDSQYFIFCYTKNLYIIKKQFRFIHFLSNRLEFVRKNHYCLKEHRIGLYFNFNKKIRPFSSRKLGRKLNTSLYSINLVSIKNSQKFISNFHAFYKIQPKLRRPIFYRKNYPDTQLGQESSLFWSAFTEPLNIKEIKLRPYYHWVFYKKITERKSGNLKLSSKSTIKARFKKVQLQSVPVCPSNKVLKVFFNRKAGLNKIFFSLLSNLKISKLSTRLYWVPNFQSFFLRLNRQGNLKFHLLNSWSIDSNFHDKNIAINYQCNQTISGISFSHLEKKLNWNITLYNFKKLYRLKTYSNPKPYLFNKKLLLDQKCLIRYLVQKIYRALYHEKQKCLNFTIGFKAQIKINTIPTVNFIHAQSISQGRKTKKLTQPLFVQKTLIDLYLDRQQFKPFHRSKGQTFLDWPYHTKSLNLLSSFGFILKRGSMALDGVIFDHHETIIDFIHLDKSSFLKKKLETTSNYRHIININKRFVTHSTNNKKLILFQKSQLNVNKKSLWFKKNIINSIYSRAKTFSLLKFNSIRYCSNFFKRTVLKPKLHNNTFHLLDQKQLSENRPFQKITSISRAQIRTKQASDKYIFLDSYSAIYKPSTGLILRDSKVSRIYKKMDPKDFLDLLNFSYKLSQLSSVKKFDFHKLNSQLLKGSKTFHIFYSRLQPPSSKNFFLVKTFINLINGELVLATTANEKTTFVVLTSSDLESVVLNSPLQLHKKSNFPIGQFIRFGDQLENKKFATGSGQIIYKDKKKFIFRKAMPFLITARSLLNVSPNEVIEKNARLFTLFYHQIKTGDIIQGIPKIEELFEARVTREGMPLLTNLHIQLKNLFNQYNQNNPLLEATQKSFEKIQQIIVDEIQKIYCSQGISIADKHLEIIVRQMTSKVQILEGGQTGLLAGELIEFDWIRLIQHKLVNEDIFYEPIILGITKSCLETESFISAASFQETTRILSKAAVQNRVDFVRGLKQNVILGNLVPAGTGFLAFY